MEHWRVKDLMVPISEYATVVIGSSLLEAMLALEKAQESYTGSKYQHKAILVLDESGTVVGKIGQLRILKAVETRYDEDLPIDDLERFNFSDSYIACLREKSRLKGPILSKKTLQAAAGKKVEAFMQAPTPGEFVSEDSTLDVAIHKLVSDSHQSLLVTKGDEIVGILRFSDVFAAVFHEMRGAGVIPDDSSQLP